MVPIGYRPILSHIMKYYAFFGHKEFVLCLGYGADVIKEYFLKYDECVSNDFVLAEGGRSITLLNTDIHDWKIAFVDTGIAASIGQRLKKVERHIGADELFLANYTDGLTDLPLPEYLAHFTKHDKVAGFLSVTPRQSFHVVEAAPDGTVLRLEEYVQSGLRINAGYFVFRRSIFQYLRAEEELVAEPFQRLIQRRQLLAYEYDGFWTAMDTFKDKMLLDDLYSRDRAPWTVWMERASDLPSSRREGARPYLKKAGGF